MIRYKIDIPSALKDAGYSQYRIRNERIIPMQTFNNILHGKMINMITLNKICSLLDLQPGDIIEWVPDEDRMQESQEPGE